jgi:hypothetical protein
MASRRNYVTTTEVAEMIGGSPTITDNQISEAEELIDVWVGFQKRFLDYKIEGRAQAGGASSLTLQLKEVDVYDIDFFKDCHAEILGGVGAGQRRRISSSAKNGVLTVDPAWDTAPDATSFYRIYQLGKFPRYCDVTFFSEVPPSTYYKQIVENVKRAVAAQVEYMIAMGDTFFTTDQSQKTAERIGDYGYELGQNFNGSPVPINRLIAPKAKEFLRHIRNITGNLQV